MNDITITVYDSVTHATTQGPLVDIELTWQNVLSTLGMCLLVFLTIMCNTFVIACIFIYKPLRIVQNFFIISLSSADLAVAILVMPFHIANNIFQGRWILGNVFCDLWLTFDVLLCTASILNICVIALDRYWAIHDPINYAQKRTVKRVLVMIFIAWALSAIISVPPMFGWNDRGEHLFNPFTLQCALTGEQGYVLYSALGSFYIPLFIMSFVYLKIFLAIKRRLREQAEKAKAKVAIVKNTPNVSVATLPDCTDEEEVELSPMVIDSDTSSAPRPTRILYQDKVKLTDETCKASNLMQTFFEEKQRISLSKERKAARTLAIIMVTFVLCWLPFFLLYVIIPFCNLCVHPGPETEIFFVWLGYINSTLNPVIYTIFNTEFRKAFSDMIHGRCLNRNSIQSRLIRSRL